MNPLKKAVRWMTRYDGEVTNTESVPNEGTRQPELGDTGFNEAMRRNEEAARERRDAETARQRQWDYERLADRGIVRSTSTYETMGAADRLSRTPERPSRTASEHIMHQAEDIFQRMITRNCGRVVHQLDEMLTDWRLVGHDRERVVNMYREARARRDAMRAPVDGPQSDDRAAYYQSQPQGVGEPPMPNSQTYAYAKSLYSNKPVAQIPKEDGILEGGEMVLPHDFYSGKSQFYDKVALCPECFHSFMVGDADKELACTACAFEFDRMPTDDFSKLKAIMNEHVTSGLAGVAGSFMGAVDQHYSTASQSPNLSAGMSLGMQQQEADFRQTIQQHNQANPNMEPVAGTFTPRVIDEIMLQNFPTVIHNNPGEWRAGAITLAAAPPGTPMTVSPSQFEVEYSYDVAFEPGTLAQPVTEADLDAALADLTRPDETSPSHPNNWNGA